MISIILPTYNREATLNLAIDSVLEQSFKLFELIIVDDGSTDNTEKLVESYSDSRILYYKIPHSGANKARNRGIKESTYDLICFQDSDAKWQPDKLKEQYKAILSLPSHYAGVFSGALLEKAGGRTRYVPKIEVREDTLYQQLLYENFIDTPALLLKKEALVKVGLFAEHLPRFQDWELALRLSQQYRLHYINQPLHISLHSSNNITRNRLAGLRAKIYIFRKHRGQIERDQRTLANHYYSLGLSIAAGKHFLTARKFFKKSISLDHWHYRAWLGLIMTLFGKARPA